jgi:hypothetical protein
VKRGFAIAGTILAVLVLLIALVYWGLVAAADGTAASHRDAFAKGVTKGMARAEVGFLAASLGGAVGAVRGQSADVAEFLGSRYLLVRFNGVHQCIDMYALEVIYNAKQQVTSTQKVDNRQCLVGSTFTPM